MSLLVYVASAVMLAQLAPPSDVFAAPSPPIEARIVTELNLAREHPQAYGVRLQRFRASLIGNVAYATPDGSGEETVEGASAVDEALRFVAHAAPRSGLQWDAALANTAQRQAEDQRRHGGVGHESSDGRSFSDRVSGLGRRGLVSEVISYGEQTEEDVVRQLIVDDGESDRGHRQNIYEPSVRRVGVACRPHPEYGYSCVIDFSSD